MFHWKPALGLLVLYVSVLAAGCGSPPPKPQDPAKVEEQMKEYRDISKKERSG
jgi:hypothetical protein